MVVKSNYNTSKPVKNIKCSNNVKEKKALYENQPAARFQLKKNKNALNVLKHVCWLTTALMRVVLNLLIFKNAMAVCLSLSQAL